MKNTIKRSLLLIPVISVLLVVLAVPVFADISTGEVSKIEASPIRVLTENVTFLEYLPGTTVVYGDVQFNFRYRVTIGMIDSEFSVGDVYNGFFIWGPIYDPEAVDFPVYLVCDQLFINDSGYFQVRAFGSSGGQSLFYPILTGATDVYLWFQEWPLTDASSVFYDLPILAVEEVVSPSSVDGITSVWTEIITWITSAMTSVMGAFYVDGSLTLLGTLAVIGVSVGIGLLLLGLIQRFLHLRG